MSSNHVGFLERILGLGRTPRGVRGTGSEEAEAARERASAPRFRRAPGPPSPATTEDGLLEGELLPTVPSLAALAADGGSGPAADPESEAGPTPGPQTDESEGTNEFDIFLSDMCATPVSPHEAELALRDATITELKRNLSALRPLGDRLAEAEKARMALEAELAEVRAELDAERERARSASAEGPSEPVERDGSEASAEFEELAAELDAVVAERDKLERARDRAQMRLGKMRDKFKKRDRVATERWHQIRSLQQERRELRDALKRAERSGQEGSDEPSEERSPVDLANGRSAAPAPDLATLFDPDPQERGDLPAPSPERSSQNTLRT